MHASARAEKFGRASGQFLTLALELQNVPGAIQRALAKLDAQVNAIARSKLTKHKDTGQSLGSYTGESGAAHIKESFEAYLRLRINRWFPMGKGWKGPMLVNAVRYLAAEARAALGTGTSTGIRTPAQEIVALLEAESEEKTRARAARAKERRAARRAAKGGA